VRFDQIGVVAILTISLSACGGGGHDGADVAADGAVAADDSATGADTDAAAGEDPSGDITQETSAEADPPEPELPADSGVADAIGGDKPEAQVLDGAAVAPDGGEDAPAPLDVAPDGPDASLAEDSPGSDACIPQCQDRECGDDGCSGSCGSCDDGSSCTTDTCDQGTGRCAFVNNRTCPPPTTYDADAKPIFSKYCVPCHSSSLASSYAWTQQASSACVGIKKGACALVRIKAGTMPPGGACTGNPATDVGKSGCLTQSEQNVIQLWVDGGMPEK